MAATGAHDPEPAHVGRLRSEELDLARISAIRRLLWAAFGSGKEGFTEADWEHALGGLHFALESAGEVVAHASVVERELHVDDRPLRAGYVEAVATDPQRQGAGLGSRLMQEVTDHIRERFELGALRTGRHSFYARLGWLTWTGRLYVRTPDGPRRTPEEEGYVMVLPTPTSPPLDLGGSLSCDWRTGDVW